MDRNTEALGDALTRWQEFPSVRQRTAVRHALTSLLDDLAPTGAPPRGAPRPRGRVESHRSPRGCILQATSSAVSVSWFPAADTDAAFGELVVIVWDGVVSRPGSAQRERHGAVARRELALRPIEVGTNVWGWQGADAVVYDAVGLAATCRDLLDRQSAAPVA